MPFVPLEPEDKETWNKPCNSPEHVPPAMIVITEPKKWVCPACGESFIIYPTRVTWNQGETSEVWMNNYQTRIDKYGSDFLDFDFIMNF